MSSGTPDGPKISPPRKLPKKAKKLIVPAGFNNYLQLIGDPPADRPRNIPILPISAKVSGIVPTKSYDDPEHKFKEFNILHPNLIADSPPEHPPRYVGPRIKSSGPPPRFVTVPKAFVPPSASHLATAGRMLCNRSCDGRIQGSYRSYFVDEANVPPLPTDIPVGPENPVKALNETWSACWDDQAGAVYYYNNVSGEATWIPPIL